MGQEGRNQHFANIDLAFSFFFARCFSAVKYVLCFYFEETEFSDYLTKREKNMFINNSKHRSHNLKSSWAV